ncbi:uncharacterized protein LOC130895405 [Diorhabda carinulata]|uniref:uncharacterized protein LOC130895405 n=1 Tax=Diorhabda carinulata TaxID=1163345 RepID=UPI00259FEDF0|nr:uncharacterized protein LOC130895405 [Diorhabda carinulata]
MYLVTKMSVQFKLLDQFKLLNHLELNFACDYSEDHRFFVINDTGVYILSFTGNLTQDSSTFSCKKQHIKVSTFTPSQCIDIDVNSFHTKLLREDVYDIVMKIEYSATLNNTKPVDPVPICAKWSPKGLADGTECYLAVLTNLHSLEVYMKYLNNNEQIKYAIISNVSESIVLTEKLKWSCANRLPIAVKLAEYKKRIHAVTPTAFTWSHLITFDETNASIIFTGHINGDITAWRLCAAHFCENMQSNAHFLGRYNSQLERITNMQWHQSSSNGGALFFSDNNGKMNVVHVMNLNEELAVFDKEQSIISEADKVRVEKIDIIKYNNSTFILVAKQRVLIVLGIDTFGEIFDIEIVCIEDYFITGIQQIGENKLLVLSLPGILTELDISVFNNKIAIKKKNISIKNDMDKYRTHGCFFSKNKVLFFVVAYPWDLQSFSKSKSYVNVFVYHNVIINPFDLLWNNNTDTIREHWDCFETLRINCIKEKRFPWLGLPLALNYDTLSLTKLKTLRLIAKISEMIFSLIPVVKNYNIKPFILLHYLVSIKLVTQRMTMLLNKSIKNKLTDFQMHSLYIQNVFLKEMVAKNILPKAKVGKTFINEMKSVMEIANEMEYPEPLTCVWCGDKIMGPLCFPPHVDTRCCFSMMPIFILFDYKCPHCKAVAHKSVEEEYSQIFCPYCDIAMEKFYFTNDQLKKQFQQFELEMSKERRSDCFKDCTQEDIQFEDIDDNATEYVILSDSEDETENTLKGIYEEFSKVKIHDDLSESFQDEDEEVRSSH